MDRMGSRESMRSMGSMEPMLKTWRGIRLILGGAASGKSEYAEKLALEGPNARIYLATMQRSASAEARIRKHVERRRDMGFITVEDPVLDLSRWEGSAAGVILLEDLPNLLANRMFADGGTTSSADSDTKDSDTIVSASMPDPGSGNSQDIVLRLEEDIARLAGHTEQLIIVSGNLFEDCEAYDDATMQYLKCLGELHRRLAVRAERVTEVVCGIPVDH